MSFESLGLSETLLRAVSAEGYHTATPIQIQAIPPLLKGRDLMGCAQTGTGKTAAFALPTLQRLAIPAQGSGPGPRGAGPRKIRSLILAPTRELAVQIGESFSVYGRFAGLRHTVVYGGVGQGPQVRALRAGVDILVATPGRLLDLMQQGFIDLAGVQILILDEADQMLDMGFIQPLRKIISYVPRRRQTLMFSATMPDEIRKLASEWLREPVHVQVTPVATPAENVKQSVYMVEQKNKPLLLAFYLKNMPNSRTLVFTRTKHGADKVVKHLQKAGIHAEAIHGNKSQSQRQRVLQQFKSDRPPVMVATDIAARGLDIDAISHVINFDLPDVPESYVHRIGRTARAGATGLAIAFCSREERQLLRNIERLTRRPITVETKQPEYPKNDAPQPFVPRHAAGSHAGHGSRPAAPATSGTPTPHAAPHRAEHQKSRPFIQTGNRRPTQSGRPTKRRGRRLASRV